MVTVTGTMALWAGPTNAVAEPRALSVDPSSGLVDGQRGTVSGSGFAPGSTTLFECRAGLVGLVDCDLATATTVTVGQDGTFQVDQQVFAVMHDHDGFDLDCRVAGRCVLAADVGFDGGASSVVAPLEFDAEASLLPAPTITVTPGADLVDRQTVTIEGQGFVHEESALPFETPTTVGVFQCGRIAVPGPGADCRQGPTRLVEVHDDGTFRAEVAVSARITTGFGHLVDCRQGTDACHIAVSAGRIGSSRRAVSELRFDPSAALPEWPDPTITVSPDVGLHDFDHLSIRGGGFTPGGVVDVGVCRVDDPRACDFADNERPNADGVGALTAEVEVWSMFDGGETAVDCRTAPGCALRALDVDRGVTVSTPLAFGPADPPRGRYRDPVFDDVQVDRDVVYRQTIDAFGRPVELKLDIYRPVGDTATSRPAVVWMHGGFFIGGDKSDMYFDAIDSAQRGYVGVSLDYRLTGSQHGMYLASLDAYDDAIAGVEWLVAHASEYGIDPDAIVAGGFSAGAVTAFNLAYLPGDRGPARSPIAAAAAHSGLIYTVPQRGEPPALAFHGTLDTITSYDNVSGKCARARLSGVVCEVVTHDGGDHGEDGSARTIRRLSSDFFADQVLRPQGYFLVTAVAGGSYDVDEGSTVTLDGTASTGKDLDFAWSPPERVDDAGTARPALSGLDDGTETVALVVTSSHGISAQDEAQVTTHNVPPSLASVQTATSGTRGVSLTGSITDPGLADTHRAEIDWGDGTIEAATVEQSAGSATMRGSHTYAEPGGYEVALTVTDDDGGTTTTDRDIAVGCTIVGTTGDDRLIGTTGDDIICGLGGDDVLKGRAGNDQLAGGSGDDRLWGGRGSDLLIGGSGRDHANGQQGRDTCDAETRRSCRPDARS